MRKEVPLVLLRIANGTSGSEGFWELLRKETRNWKSVTFPFQKK